jgi:hypothetical protein
MHCALLLKKFKQNERFDLNTTLNVVVYQALVGKPKLFFIEACRGQAQNHGMPLMSKVRIF